MTKARAYFFSGIKNPAEVSEIVVGMASGRVFETERITLASLPAIVLLCTIGLRQFRQQIVDDYAALLIRLRDTMRDPTVWHDRVWHPHLYYAIRIAEAGSRGEYTVPRIPELSYLPDLYQEIVNAELEDLIPESVTEVTE